MAKSKREIPLLHRPIIETHCHLDYLKEGSTADILARCQSLGIEKVITISVSPDNLQTVLDIAEEFEQVFTTQGIHPHQADLWTEDVANTVLKNAALPNTKVLAIGEIGLDFYYTKSKKEKQIEAFNRQMDIATTLNLPVVIHSREAETETIAVLDEKAPALKRKGVIHSFTSGPVLAQAALKHDFYLGFNGIITFKNAEEVREIVKICPLERILLETDSPFLTPFPYRGQENAPYFLPFVAEKVAEIKGLDVEEVLEVTYQNALDLFKF
jgi:TatD DNase family protein